MILFILLSFKTSFCEPPSHHIYLLLCKFQESNHISCSTQKAHQQKQCPTKENNNYNSVEETTQYQEYSEAKWSQNSQAIQYQGIGKINKKSLGETKSWSPRRVKDRSNKSSRGCIEGKRTRSYQNWTLWYHAQVQPL